MGGNSPPLSPRTACLQTQITALAQEMAMMFRQQTDEFHDRIEQLERNRSPRHSSRADSEGSEGRRRRERHEGRRGGYDGDREDSLGGIKIKVPSFQGRNDPEAYLVWEMKVDQIFSCHDFTEARKVQVAALEFTDYALVWWDQNIKDKRRNEEPQVATWEEMKRLMRRRFVPSYFYRELHNKLQRLTQGSKSVDEYHKEMELALIRANVVERS